MMLNLSSVLKISYFYNVIFNKITGRFFFFVYVCVCVILCNNLFLTIFPLYSRNFFRKKIQAYKQLPSSDDKVIYSLRFLWRGENVFPRWTCTASIIKYNSFLYLHFIIIFTEKIIRILDKNDLNWTSQYTWTLFPSVTRFKTNLNVETGVFQYFWTLNMTLKRNDELNKTFLSSKSSMKKIL